MSIASLSGRILDCDAHEHITSGHWAEVFGPQTGSLREIFEELHDPDSTNSLTAHVEQDDRPISVETTWRQAGWAPGAMDMPRRVEVLDFLGFQEQLILSTVPGILGQILVSAPPEALEPEFGIDLKDVMARVGLGDIDDGTLQTMCIQLGRGLFDEWNDWSIRTANVSPRLRPVAFIDTLDLKRSISEIDRLARSGIRAINIPSGTPPGGISPGHPDCDPLWEAFVANDIPVIFHGGGSFGLLREQSVWVQYGSEIRNVQGRYNSLEVAMDPYSVSLFFLGVQNFITLMIFGGVFERFPTLRVGCIENGAAWVGPTAEYCELVGSQFKSRIKHLSLTPKEYLARNVRVTPFFFEPVDRYIERFGLEDVYIYGSDYPHHEGGFDPTAAHVARLESLGQHVLEKFFVTNGQLLMP